MSDVDHDVEMNAEECEVDSEEEVEIPEDQKKVYLPGISRPLKEGEVLEYDPSAYKVYHTFTTNWPCLSFDVVRDGLGDNRTNFPVECYLVSGTCADKPKDNEINVIALKNLGKMEEEKEKDSEDDDSSDEEDEEEAKKKEPVMHSVSISHYGDVNRIRAARLGDSTVSAVWNDNGRVQIWNLTSALNIANELTGESQHKEMKNEKPLYSENGFNKPGFALAWNPLKVGDLATGDVAKNIFLWQMQEGGKWAVSGKSLVGHKKSVEDVAWSPTEENLLCSCSVDGTIKLWDARASPKSACVVSVENAHASDVNVISWNAFDSLIVSGGDDSELKVWSLKTIQHGQPVARFKYHSKPITSVEWHPQETTTFIATSEDDQTTIWDIATETDEGQDIEGVPPQLMFVHMGQKELKEVHWHPQIPGLALTTAVDGFNAFKSINY